MIQSCSYAGISGRTEPLFDLKGAEPGAVFGTDYQTRQAASVTALSALFSDEELQSTDTGSVLTSCGPFSCTSDYDLVRC